MQGVYFDFGLTFERAKVVIRSETGKLNCVSFSIRANNSILFELMSTKYYCRGNSGSF